MNGQDPQTMENVAMLTKALRERDEQIEQLQENLSQASKEIESSAALIESLTNAKKKGGKGVDPIQKSLINVRAQLQKSEEKIAELEESLKEAEDAAKYVVLGVIYKPCGQFFGVFCPPLPPCGQTRTFGNPPLSMWIFQ